MKATTENSRPISKKKFTKSTPNPKDVIIHLLAGKPLNHNEWIAESNGKEHRLSIAIHDLRHKYGFTIECPRSKNDPLYCYYFIRQSNLAEARELAQKHGFI